MEARSPSSSRTSGNADDDLKHYTTSRAASLDMVKDRRRSVPISLLTSMAGRVHTYLQGHGAKNQDCGVRVGVDVV